MKKICVIILAVFMVGTVALPVFARPPASAAHWRRIQWNGAADKGVAVRISEVRNHRRVHGRPSGPMIASNAHNADFPDLFFIWDSRHMDNGYLKVRTSVFDRYESITLTVREPIIDWSFSIAPHRGQRTTRDDCYVFYIPKAQGNRKINMVFISELTERMRRR